MMLMDKNMMKEVLQKRMDNQPDNRIGYDDDYSQHSQKLLFRMFNGQEKSSSRDLLNILKTLKSSMGLMDKNQCGRNQIQSIQDQIEQIMNMKTHRSVDDNDDEETSLKMQVATNAEDYKTEEKGDKEKEVYYAMCEQREWEHDDDQSKISLKEDMEESEKINNEASLEEEKNVSLKDEFELSEKMLHQLSGCSPIVSIQNDDLPSVLSFCELDLQNGSFEVANPSAFEFDNQSYFEFDSGVVNNDMRLKCSLNSLSSGAFISLSGLLVANASMDLNISLSLTKSFGTCSFNGFFEGKGYQTAANKLSNIDYEKDQTKKSPFSLDNRHSDSGLGTSDSDGSSIPTHSEKYPRGRPGSNSKSKGERQRSRRHSNREDRKSSGNRGRNSGHDSFGRGDSSGGGGGGGGGEGNRDGDDRKKARDGKGYDEDDEEEDESDEDNKVDDGDDEEEGEDESDDDNKVDDGKDKEVLSKSNLSGGTNLQDKAMNKDLTPLLSDNSLEPCQSPKPEGAFNWRIESETFNVVSLLQELPNQDDEMGRLTIDHSCIPLFTVCDILGNASIEDYLPRDDIFFPLNKCLTTLTHNMSLDLSDCAHCSLLTNLLKHVAKCSTGLSCEACLQGYNIMLHHAKNCMESKRIKRPFSRMDLCFKLCQSVSWQSQELFGPKKAVNKQVIKKLCIKILTMPYDQEITDSSSNDIGSEVMQSAERLPSSGNIVDKPSTAPGQGVQHPLVSQSHHSTLNRKPSNSRRRTLPPSIHEDEEDEDKDHDETENKKKDDDSPQAIIRREYGSKTNEPPGALSERDYANSLPLGNIKDQTQFSSLVSQATGVKGVGEVVYSDVNQLCLVADYWDEKKQEYKSTRQRPYQRAEEGVILKKYQYKMKILCTRYKMDYQWYKLTDLGNGMNGHCYLAMDNETSFKFCVKKIHLMDYKKEELCFWADLNHPNIVKVYGALRHSEYVYLLIEYIDGGDLAHCIEDHKSRGERVSHWLALKYFQQLLGALVYLEFKNLLHEDIKADNLLLRAGDFQIVLTDFGLCHRLQKPVELKDKLPAGTQTHFSPEKAASMGHGFPACVWACVCVLVHMLSGQQPWSKYLKKVDYLNFTIYMKPPPLDDVPDNIRSIVKDLIAQGFTKDPEKRPNAQQLLQHEAFNILNQETETYFSNLASTFQSNVGVTSRAQRDRGTVVRDTTTARGSMDAREQEVSLYEISVPHVSKATNYEEENLQMDVCSGKELEGAVGGELSQPIEREDILPITSSQAQNQVVQYQLSSSSDHESPKDAVTPNTAPLSNTIQEMVDARVPKLDMLLQSDSDESTISFLTDVATPSWNIQTENLPVNLEVFNPGCNTRSINSVHSNELPVMSILNPSGNSSSDVVRMNPSENSSSEVIDSAELYTPGLEIENESQNMSDIPAEVPQDPTHFTESFTHFTEKKPADLKLEMDHGGKVAASLSTSRSSSSTANITTASSQGSSVFYPGSARVNPLQDFAGMLVPSEEETKKKVTEEDKAEKKAKVEERIAQMRQSIGDSNTGGVKITFYDENRQKLFNFLMTYEDTLPVKQYISDFKARIQHKHFELKMMCGRDIDYNSSFKVTEVMVVAQPDMRQCWCAVCQF